MARRDYVRLLDVEPRLGAGLSASGRPEARRLVVAPVMTLADGQWDAAELTRILGDCAPFGCMVAEGLIAHELELAGRAATYLLGRGDIVAPGVTTGGDLPLHRLFCVADPVRLALLDKTFLAVTQRWPSIAGALLLQVVRQSERVAVHQLISQFPRADDRILALLWHLADRWGRPEPAGIVVPLAMGHEAIARLVGGRRPTVSSALGRLADRNVVSRLANGTWLLEPESRSLLDGSGPLGPAPDVRLLGPQDCDEDPADPVEPGELGACFALSG
jgi:CRP-like cAMP-binding protein